MKATIVEIASGSTFVDGEQRVTIKFEDGDSMINRVRFPISKLGLAWVGTGPQLDHEVDVEFSRVARKGKMN